MAVTDHIEVYRSFTNEELEQERRDLLAWRQGGFTSQAVGGKTFTRDINVLNDQLRAVVRVQNERRYRAGGGSSSARVDFSDLS